MLGTNVFWRWFFPRYGRFFDNILVCIVIVMVIMPGEFCLREG